MQVTISRSCYVLPLAPGVTLTNILKVEGYTIERTVVRERRTDGEGYFDSKVYRFRKTTAANTATADLD